MAVLNHLAIIPDGNRRWAKAKGLNPWEGHTAGAKLFWEISYAALDAQIPNITYWAGSYSNLKNRSKVEVKFLLHIMAEELTNTDFLTRCIEQQARFLLIGEWRDFVADKKIIDSLQHLMNATAHFTTRTLTILFGYDGQREMISAVQNLVDSGNDVTSENLRAALWTADLPDVDLVIRTGGEPHWSAGFMMWLTANSQFYFTEKLWPDFDKKELKKALDDFERRERRLGK